MRTRSYSFLCLAAAMILNGCSASVVESTAPTTSEHHGGVLVPLTENQCYVELLNGTRDRKGKEFQTTLVAYLFQPDQKTAFGETATLFEVKMPTAKGERTVPLQASPDTADPNGSARYVSQKGPYELTQAGGEITVRVGDKTWTGTFRGPR